MSNTPDSISTEALKALYDKATEKKTMEEKAPWKGTEESVGNPDLGIIQQAIDAVDDNCQFAISEFLKGAHYSLYLYLRNVEAELASAVEEGDTEAIIHLSARIGQVRNIYESLGETFDHGNNDDEDKEEA